MKNTNRQMKYYGPAGIPQPGRAQRRPHRRMSNKYCTREPMTKKPTSPCLRRRKRWKNSMSDLEKHHIGFGQEKRRNPLIRIVISGLRMPPKFWFFVFSSLFPFSVLHPPRTSFRICCRGIHTDADSRNRNGCPPVLSRF